MSPMVSREQISTWLDGWIERTGKLSDPFAVTADELYMLIGSNLGWYWDTNEIPQAPHPTTGELSAIQGMYKLLDELMAAKKRRRDGSV